MKYRRYSIGEAARKTGLAATTLIRAEKSERIRFTREDGGWRFILQRDLERAPIYELRRAARLMSISLSRLSRMAHKVERRSILPPDFRRWGHQRFFSLKSIKAFAEGRTLNLAARCRIATWIYRRGDRKVIRLKGRSLIITYHAVRNG
jgi:hypothetical protein